MSFGRWTRVGGASSGPSHVLLTGATGGLGREVLSRLLDHGPGRAPAGQVTLLIRGGDPGAVRERLEDLKRNLIRWRSSLDISRVSAVRGDIARPDLGLDAEMRRELTRDVTHVVHCAASIELTQPIDRARASNVRGTEAILAFAARCAALVRLVHVSTAFVAGDRVGVIAEDELDCGQAFLNGYERSKFEGELRVRSRMLELPITVVRPSIVVGDSHDGHAAGLSTLFPVLRHVAAGRLRRFPGSGAAPLDLVPVDYVADAIVFLLGEARAEGGTFHLVAGPARSLSVRRLFEMAIAMFGRAAATPLRFGGDGGMPPAGPSRRLYQRLRCYFDYLAASKSFDDTRFRRLAGAAIPECPDPIDYLPRVLAFARDRLGPIPRDRRPGRPNRVALARSPLCYPSRSHDDLRRNPARAL